MRTHQAKRRGQPDHPQADAKNLVSFGRGGTGNVQEKIYFINCPELVRSVGAVVE